MKRIILCFVWVFALTTISFAQLPHSMRVLNYVPDNCYSLEVVNLNDVAHDLELKIYTRIICSTLCIKNRK